MTRVRDPIHDYIDLSPLEASLVDTPSYQRLRWIRQLGQANLVYPGANHTRHEHCMGTCHLVNKMADIVGLNDDEKRLCSVAGLLHDLGHTPFSHLGDEVRDVDDHVVRTNKIISDSNISEILNENDIDYKEVNSIIRGEHKLGPLVSGDLDGDRLDYLVRDAHYTGVKTGVDTSRLIATMSINEGELVIKEGGLPAVESLLTTRSIMYSTVYFHSFARGAELMLARATEQAISSDTFTVGEFEHFTDHQLLSELSRSTEFCKEVVDNFEKRNVPKRAISFTKEQSESSGLSKSQSEEYEAAISSKLKIDKSKIYVDIPPSTVVPSMKVKILKDDGQIDLARNLSRLVSGLYEAQFDHWRGRVYGPLNMQNEINSVSKQVLGL